MILGGSVRPTPFVLATGRSVVDLPAGPDESILGRWQREVASLVDAGLSDRETLLARVFFNREAPLPASPPRDSRVDLQLLRDLREFRGSGGLLRDLTRDHDPAGYILVANGAQLLLEPLVDLARALGSVTSDVSLISHASGAPGGLMLIRCGCLDRVPDIGYCDLKEQALPEIARRHRVCVVERSRPSGFAIRSACDYLKALDHIHRSSAASLATSPRAGPGRDDLWERGRRRFAIVEDGARVDSGGRVHDSVILRGGRVKAGAFVARSIVCSGGVVRRCRTVVNQVVSSAV